MEGIDVRRFSWKCEFALGEALFLIVAVVAAIASVAYLSGCATGPTQLEQFRAAIGADAPNARLRAAVALPPYAFCGRFDVLGRCTLIGGMMRENGELTTEGDTLHPAGHGGDPFVWREGELYRMDFQHPVYDRELRRWPTAIAHTTSTDGLRWTPPKLIRKPIYHEDGNPQPTQFETPAHAEIAGQHVRALLTYRYEGRWSRRDSVTLWASRDVLGPLEQFGSPLSPELAWEQPWLDPDGDLVGGVQEPTFLGPFGPWVIVVYGAVTYGKGFVPSIGLAGTPDGGQTWVRLPDPIIPDGGQPHAFRDPRGGFHLFWQMRDGPRYEVHHAFSAGNLAQWHLNPANPVLASGGPDWLGRITAPSVLIEEREGRWVWRMWFFGHPDEDERTKWIGAADWVGRP